MEVAYYIEPKHLPEASYPVYCVQYITPPGGIFPRSIARQTKREPTSNDTSPESSRRDASNADLLGADIIPTIVEISTIENGPGGCDIHRHIIRYAFPPPRVVDCSRGEKPPIMSL